MNSLFDIKKALLYSLLYMLLTKDFNQRSKVMIKIKNKLQIKNRINVLRAERKISQESLAKAIEVTRATISSIENENYNPSLELAFRLALFFETEVATIFYLDKENSHD